MEVLTESHLETRGGYPHDWKELPDGSFAVAEITYDGAARLEIYSAQIMSRWVTEMQAMIDDPEYEEERESEDWDFFVYESEPQESIN